MTRNTKREDRKALIAAAKAYHAAKLTWMYGTMSVGEQTFLDARGALVHAAEVYAVGRHRASVTFAQKHYTKQRKAAA